MNIKKIKINLSTYVLIFLLLFSGYKKYLLYLLIVIIVHELGHVFFIKLFNLKILNIEIYPFGGIIRINKNINYPPIKELLISSGGIIFQLLLFFVNNDVLYNLNIRFIFINLIPLVPLDGSKILYTLITYKFSFYYSYIIYIILNIIFLLLYIYISVLNDNLNLMLLSVVIISIYKEIKGFKKLINKFYLERYLNKNILKKKKYYKKNNIKLLSREKEGFFFINYWENEEKILSKKFDIRTYF